MGASAVVRTCVATGTKRRAAMVQARRVKRAGLLATQAIRGGASRETLKRIKESGDIFFAESTASGLGRRHGSSSMVGFDDGSRRG